MDSEILNNAKMLLEISDNSKDELLLFYIDDIKSAVLSYCRIDNIPITLMKLISQIVADIYKKSDKSIISVTEGDRKIDFLPSSKTVIDEYYERLKPFRNISATLPSDIGKRDINVQ